MNVNLDIAKTEKLSKNGKQYTVDFTGKTSILSFLFILSVAVYLRLPGIYSGLPYVLNPEEANNLIKVLYFFKGLFKFNSFEPSLFNLLNSLVVFFNSWTLDVNSILNVLEERQGSFYVSLRFLSVLFGVGSVAVLYFIGAMFNPLVAVLASGFLSVSFLHVKYSQLFLPFSALVFLSLLNIFLLVKSFNNKNFNPTPALIFSLISSSINYIGLVNYAPVFFAMALKKDFSKLKTFLPFGIISFVLINPQAILGLPGLIAESVKNYRNGYFLFHGSSYLLHFFSSLLQGVGPVVWISMFFSPFFKENHNSNLLKLLFSFPLAYLGVIGLFHVTKIGYGVMLVPFACLLAGLFFNCLYEKISSENIKFLFIILLLFGFWIPLKYTFKYKKIMELPDTRIIATEWVEANAGGDVKIVWDKNSIQPKWFDSYNKTDLEDLIKDPYLITDKRKYMISPELLNRKRWLKLLKKKIDYLIVNNIDYENALREPSHRIEKKYYRAVLKLEPEIIFNPYLIQNEKRGENLLIEELYSPYLSSWERERPGPIVKIYKM